MDPFTRPDSASLNDMVADAAVARLAEGGVELLTLRSVAAWLGMTRQGLSQRLDDPLGPRQRLIQLIVLTFGARWLAWVDRGGFFDDAASSPVRLPETDHEVHGVRVWAALFEVARGRAADGDPHPLTAVAGIRDEERALLGRDLARWCTAPVSSETVTMMHALTEGLRFAVSSPVEPLPVDAARRILDAQLEQLAAGRRTAAPESTPSEWRR